MKLIEDTRDWCREQFASAEFGNVSRARRAAVMLRRALERPAGRLTDAFSHGAEQQEVRAARVWLDVPAHESAGRTMISVNVVGTEACKPSAADSSDRVNVARRARSSSWTESSHISRGTRSL